MPNEPVPMMNAPVVATSAALAAIGITAESPEQQEQLNDQLKDAVFAQLEDLTGLSFDRETGECTTEGDICMEGDTKEGWAEICQQLGTEKDPKRVEQLWREAGALLRGAAVTPEVKPTDS